MKAVLKLNVTLTFTTNPELRGRLPLDGQIEFFYPQPYGDVGYIEFREMHSDGTMGANVEAPEAQFKFVAGRAEEAAIRRRIARGEGIDA